MEQNTKEFLWQAKQKLPIKKTALCFHIGPEIGVTGFIDVSNALHK